jgi:hypothetical protein
VIRPVGGRREGGKSTGREGKREDGRRDLTLSKSPSSFFEYDFDVVFHLVDLLLEFSQSRVVGWGNSRTGKGGRKKKNE